mgnify:CR=1 FL=1
MGQERKALQRRIVLQKLGLLGGTLALSACDVKDASEIVDRGEPKPSSTSKQDQTRGVSQLPDGLDRNNFIVHNENPLGLESRREKHTSSPITPLQKLFVRNNLPMPSEEIVQNPSKWTIDIQEHKMSLSELKTLPLSHETMVLQCSGNGRGFFEHGASGSQWETGAAGCVIWTGVHVEDVIDYLGIDIDVNKQKYLTATGGDPLPEGVDEKKVLVERSIPIQKGIRDCLLAWEVNGVPIPISHGGPLRMVVPGFFGCNQIKYVKKIVFSEEQSQAKIQRTGYRFRPIGSKGEPSQPSMWRMPVKSWILGQNIFQKGMNSFFGVAFSGERGIKGVSFSIDNGKNWQEAELLSPDLGRNAWRSFCVRCKLPVGTHRIFTRATDMENDTQPEYRVENERGYGHNGWRDHGFLVEVVEKLDEKISIVVSKDNQSSIKISSSEMTEKVVDPIELSQSAQRGQKIFSEGTQPNCGVCHTLEHAQSKGVVGPNLNSLQPTKEQIQQAVEHGVGAMPEFSAQLSNDQISDIANYIIEVTKK